MGILRVMILIFVSFGIFSCSSYGSFIDGLNRRKINSCWKYEGVALLGSGMLAKGSGSLKGMTATGGATIDICKEILEQ